jgi:2-polyprenyl-3-methyl-5-hydroxy-6-metoxy-1,4-benzoquinol methylase
MAHEDRARWDTIYRQRSQQQFPDPDPFLFDYTPPVSAHEERRALDIAGGQGQNGLWLAAQGYTVDVMDISRMALARGRQEMIARGLRRLNFLPVDLDTVELEPEHYDVVCVFRYLKRDLFPALRACVRPGGRIIYETYNTHYQEIVPAFNPAFLLQPGELAGLFADWKLLHASDTQHVSRLAALKPGR